MEDLIEDARFITESNATKAMDEKYLCASRACF
jgi:hypothetical protein